MISFDQFNDKIWEMLQGWRAVLNKESDVSSKAGVILIIIKKNMVKDTFSQFLVNHTMDCIPHKCEHVQAETNILSKVLKVGGIMSAMKNPVLPGYVKFEFTLR